MAKTDGKIVNRNGQIIGFFDYKATGKEFDIKRAMAAYTLGDAPWFEGLAEAHEEIGFSIFSSLGKDSFAFVLEPDMSMDRHKKAIYPAIALKKEIEGWVGDNYPPIELLGGKTMPNPDIPFTVSGNGYGDKVVVTRK